MWQQGWRHVEGVAWYGSSFCDSSFSTKGSAVLVNRGHANELGKSASLSPSSHQELDVPHEAGGASMINDADADLIARARFDDLRNIRQASPHPQAPLRVHERDDFWAQGRRIKTWPV